MHDTELYEKLLGLEAPWSVDSVDLDVSTGRVDIWVDHADRHKFACPKCGHIAACRDHAPERVWRHLDSCQFQTLLHARIPRVECPEHGVLQVDIPWAAARARFTLLMERWVIDVLTECATVQGACRLLGLSWDEVWGICRRAVARGLARKEERIVPRYGVDEKAFKRGHNYMTVVCDLDRSTVEYVADDRKTESLEGFWESLSTEQKEGVECVTMDMWQAYRTATRNQLPAADEKIVFDRFHIMQHMVKAVDKVRRQEHKALLKQGDESLKGSRNLWLFSEENLSDTKRATLDELKALNLKVAKAWAIKESLRGLWDYLCPTWARKFFKKWYAWASRCGLDPVVKVAHMIKRHLDNVLTYCTHRMTNAVAEGINSKIMAIKRRAGGYRNPEHFKIAIYFFCGGLELYPR